MTAKRVRVAKRVVSAADGLVDACLLVGLLVLLLFGLYSLWDSNSVYQQADSSNYRAYKPDRAEAVPSYDDLVRMNPDVVGWLTLYGTKVDYPLVQGADNQKYLQTNAMGEYSLTGSLFLDYRSNKDFSDFATVVYGHHMDHESMFGGLSDFYDEDYFDAHEHGDLYAAGRHWGLTVVAAIPVDDAYNTRAYDMPVTSDGAMAYWSAIDAGAVRSRDVDVGPDDHLVVMSTCSSDSTNGRMLLVAKVSDETFPDPFGQDAYTGTGLQNTLDGLAAFLKDWWWLVLPVLIALLLLAAHALSKGAEDAKADGVSKRTASTGAGARAGSRPSGSAGARFEDGTSSRRKGKRKTKGDR